MMSLRQIERLSAEAGQRAAKLKRVPLVAFCDKDEAVVKCPNLGTYCPDGWKEIDRLFVDKTGFGSDSEPALTLEQFIDKVKEGYGYAIVEEGQLQLYIGVFKEI